MQDVIGQYRYITYSRYIIENQYLQNSDYFMINPEIMMVPDPNEQLKHFHLLPSFIFLTFLNQYVNIKGICTMIESPIASKAIIA